jgi:hypothetical protein
MVFSRVHFMHHEALLLCCKASLYHQMPIWQGFGAWMHPTSSSALRPWETGSRVVPRSDRLGVFTEYGIRSEIAKQYDITSSHYATSCKDKG